jgi:hypothetical protein
LRIFKVKTFARFARKESLTDISLLKAIDDAERGLVDADLGGGLIKQRVARPGKGKSGGFRTVIAFRSKERAIFLFGFAKSDLDNIEDDVLNNLRRIAALWLDADENALKRGLDSGLITGVKTDGKSKGKNKPERQTRR